MFLQREVEVLGKEMVFVINVLVKFVVLLIISVISASIMQFVTILIVKTKPLFKTTFYISVCNWVLFGGGIWLTLGNDDIPFIHLLPFLLFFATNWILSSKFLIDSEEKTVGFQKGAVVALIMTALVGAFLMLLAVLFVAKLPR